MLTVIRQATAGDYVAFFAHHPIASFVAWDGGERVAMGGLIERDGDVWGYLDVRGTLSAETGLDIVRAMRRALKVVTRDVKITCDVDTFPGAPRLLKACGFTATNEMHHQKEVWICRASKS